MSLAETASSTDSRGRKRRLEEAESCRGRAPPPAREASTSGADSAFGACHHGAVRAGGQRELSDLASRVALRGLYHAGTRRTVGCVRARVGAGQARFPSCSAGRALGAGAVAGLPGGLRVGCTGARRVPSRPAFTSRGVLAGAALDFEPASSPRACSRGSGPVPSGFGSCFQQYEKVTLSETV